MIVSLLVGVVVTLLSSLVPALRSTRVPPIAALHAFAPPPSRRRRVALPGPLGPARRSAGLALVLAGLFGGGDAGAAARR